jgi:hypothetical protein
MLAAVAGGILVGLSLGGSLGNLGEARFRWWPLALLGLAMQFIPVPSRSGQADHLIAVTILTASYGVLLLFVLMNIRTPGFALVGVGLALNALVIGVNGGMPVDAHALRHGAGSAYQAERQRLMTKGRFKHHLAGPGDVLLPLSDRIGIGGPVRNVFSVGDFIAYAGVGWALAALTAGSPGRHRLSRPGKRVADSPAVTPEPDADPLVAPAGAWAVDRSEEPRAAGHPPPPGSSP